MPSILTCALVSDDVYQNRSSGVATFKRAHIPGNQRYISSHFFGAAYSDGPVGIIAFRGSHEIEDWTYADVDIALNRLPVDQIGNAFGYFGSASSELARRGCNRLVVTGHSLGGGLAAVVAARISRIPVTGVTFNAPGLANCTRVVAPEDELKVLRAWFALGRRAAQVHPVGRHLARIAEAVFDEPEAHVTIPRPNRNNVWNIRTYYDPVSLKGAPIGEMITIPESATVDLTDIWMEHTMGNLLQSLRRSILGSIRVQ